MTTRRGPEREPALSGDNLYDCMIFAAHPDDAEVQMGGTIAKLTDQGLSLLIVDLCDGEGEGTGGLAGSARPEVEARACHAHHVHRAHCADWLNLGVGEQDHFIRDSIPLRVKLADLIRRYRPRWVFGVAQECSHHECSEMNPRSQEGAVVGAIGALVKAAVFYSRLYARASNWDQVPGGAALTQTEPWIVEHVLFPQCKTEPGPESEFDFAVDVSATYERKQRALAEYRPIFTRHPGYRLPDLHGGYEGEAENTHTGRLFGVAYAEMFNADSPLLVDDLTVFRASLPV